MHTEIEKLIEFALVDGQITEKERNVIVKKAITLGIDEDEIEMIIDAKIHKYNSSKKRENSDKIEELKKCPSCGNIISGLSKTCLCGFVINSGEIKNSKSLDEAIEILENLIVEIRSLKENPNKLLEERISAKIEKEIRYINVRYSDNLIVKKLITELEELSNSAIFTIKKKRQRKKTISSILILILVIIIGFVIFKKVTNKTPEQRFKISVNELYKDKIIEYKNTEDYKNDSIYFYKLYDDVLKNALASQKYGKKLDERWEKIKIKSPSPFKYYFLARKYRRNGDLNNAKKFCDTCKALYPKFAPIYFNLSSFENDKFDVKLENLNKAIELDKDKTRYLFTRSDLYYKNNDVQKALDDINKFNSENQNNFYSKLSEISYIFSLNLNEMACEKYVLLKKQFSVELANFESPSTILMIEKACK